MPHKKSIASLKNLGPKSETRLIAADITDAQTLQRVGAATAYHRIKTLFPADTSLNLLWALQGAIMDLHWHNIPNDIKQHLLTELETIPLRHSNKNRNPRVDGNR